MSTLFVDHLTVVDFSYLDPRRGLVGESWLLDVQLEGELNDEGMVFDFSHVKRDIKHWVDLEADHKLLVPTQNPNIQITSSTEHHLIELHQQGQLVFRVQCPLEAVCLLDSHEITCEHLRTHLQQLIAARLPSNVINLEFNLSPEVIQGAYYHYSHGLKKHQGDCQRIAHGHRSRLVIHVNHQRHPELEKQWAKRWTDVYLISSEDLLPCQPNLEHLHHSGYEAQQGRFDIWVPKNQAEILPTDTTVELIAQYMANCIAEQLPGNAIRVQAFEGVNKGAIARAQTPL